MKEVQVFLVGGGGSGEACGGGGGYTNTYVIPVSGINSIGVTIGNGGSNTIISDKIANAGKSGYYMSGSNIYNPAAGGSGGSGGGGRSIDNSSPLHGPNGGSNGSDGESNYEFSQHYQTRFLSPGGKGQGTTTRAFGEENGTLYAGGGGGYAYSGHGLYVAGVGGAGGGGNGCNGYDGSSYGTPGDVNTGGGGGPSRNGGSGIAIIRWGY